ncbi:MAG: hypothetical protein A2V85_08015 [Chloroflexi bacterium RBG_16_72_14]|nr:MAG: hypothetical protein A2V85_08015 [Chloroflexi bacterium RBG_16_72_14]
MAAERHARLPIVTPRAGLTEHQLERLFRGSIVFLVIATVPIVTVPVVHGHFAAPAIDLALDTMAGVVSAAVMILAWANFSERRTPMALFQASAFLCLTVAYGSAVLISLGRDQDVASLADPNPLQTYVFALARVLAATLIVIGGTAAAGRLGAARSRLILIGPAIAPVAVALLGLVGGWSPPLALQVAAADPDRSGLPAVTAFGVLVQLVLAALFFQAAMVCRDRWRREGDVANAWMAIGLVFAAFAEIHWAAFPAGHPGQVSTADLLRLVFFLALLLGIEAEARQVIGRLRVANVELASLRESEVERAAIEERARLARELHDGLAQDLWLAKLKTGQLATWPGLPADALPLVEEAQAAIDTGLAEARQAVMALRLAAEHELGFHELMARYVEDFEDRFGLRVEFTSGGDTSRIAPRTQAEVLRIAQEALVNVRQHADATVVGVRLAIDGDQVSLRVVDNGRGFDVAAAKRSSFGLHAMRERATLIGGRVSVVSAPGEGTRVTLTAPLHAEATTPGAGG